MSDPYRLAALAALTRLGQLMDDHDGEPLVFMEVCGTHTMSIAREGIQSLLPAGIRLVSGPGCPVCVTPVGYIDHALALAALPGVIITTFGDLVRVPGSRPDRSSPRSLQHARAEGGDIRVVYSPIDALRLAADTPDRQIVFLSVGFETTTPGIAAAVLRAHDQGIDNFSVLCANKTVPEAMMALATAPDLALSGFLCPGHASVIIGPEPYEALARDQGVPCAIAGFEAAGILEGLVALTEQVAQGQPRVDNCYPLVVRPGGNPKARELMYRVFEPTDSTWRGLGVIPHSGLRIRDEHARFDAARRFTVDLPTPVEPFGCACGEVLRGVLEPPECPLFGDDCTPESPVGACMVSTEGTCAAWYAYRPHPLGPPEGGGDREQS